MKNLPEIPVQFQKSFRPADFVATQVIRSVAFLSLAAIVLIFVFVIREAIPAGKHAPVAGNAASAVIGESETYGEVAAPETYGEPAADSGMARGTDSVTTKDSTITSAATNVAPPTQGFTGSDGELSAKNLLGTRWDPVSAEPAYGIFPLLVGSLKVTFLALLIAAPVGILSALFTTAFAPAWMRGLMKPVIEILAGIPSVVIGFFALVVLASVVQDTFGLEYRLNALVGGIAMSLAVIPIIYTLSEDALNAVPKNLSEASLALGSTRWETALFIQLPAAIPGIFAALLLGIGRAFGETMIVLMATGNAPQITAGLIDPVRTLSATIGAEMAEVVFGETHYTVLFVLGVVLFLFSFVLNAIAETFVRQRLMKRFKGV